MADEEILKLDGVKQRFQLSEAALEELKAGLERVLHEEEQATGAVETLREAGDFVQRFLVVARDTVERLGRVQQEVRTGNQAALRLFGGEQFDNLRHEVVALRTTLEARLDSLEAAIERIQRSLPGRWRRRAGIPR